MRYMFYGMYQFQKFEAHAFPICPLQIFNARSLMDLRGFTSFVEEFCSQFFYCQITLHCLSNPQYMPQLCNARLLKILIYFTITHLHARQVVPRIIRG